MRCLLAQDGRELKFMFLPEGHDPDTLVAEEGPQAFESPHERLRCRCRSIWSSS